VSKILYLGTQRQNNALMSKIVTNKYLSTQPNDIFFFIKLQVLLNSMQTDWGCSKRMDGWMDGWTDA